jgi:hypothetical protein
VIGDCRFALTNLYKMMDIYKKTLEVKSFVGEILIFRRAPIVVPFGTNHCRTVC